MTLLFFGSGRVALPALQALHRQLAPLEVVTHPSPFGRNINEVETYCRDQGIPLHTPVNDKIDKSRRANQWENFIEVMPQSQLAVVCSYGFMLPSKLLGKLPRGGIVAHPSLLPRYRGGAPIFHTIANGDKVSGVSFIEASRGKFDEGALLHQIETILSSAIAQTLPFVIANLDNLRPGTPQNQLEKDIPPHLLKAPLVKYKHLELSRTAESAYHWSRALGSPKVILEATGKEIIIRLSSEFLEDSEQSKIGTLKVVGKKLFVKCSDRFVRVAGWYQPSKKQLAPGIFIAEYFRSGKFDTHFLRFI